MLLCTHCETGWYTLVDELRTDYYQDIIALSPSVQAIQQLWAA